MSFKKQYLKTKPVCKVTFRLSKKEARSADSVKILGDFNGWNEKSQPMKRLKNGDFTTTLDLPKDNDYQFRYLLDDNKWENDWNADNYIQSPISHSENSVITV